LFGSLGGSAAQIALHTDAFKSFKEKRAESRAIDEAFNADNIFFKDGKKQFKIGDQKFDISAEVEPLLKNFNRQRKTVRAEARTLVDLIRQAKRSKDFGTRKKILREVKTVRKRLLEADEAKSQTVQEIFRLQPAAADALASERRAAAEKIKEGQAGGENAAPAGLPPEVESQRASIAAKSETSPPQVGSTVEAEVRSSGGLRQTKQGKVVGPEGFITEAGEAGTRVEPENIQNAPAAANEVIALDKPARAVQRFELPPIAPKPNRTEQEVAEAFGRVITSGQPFEFAELKEKGKRSGVIAKTYRATKKGNKWLVFEPEAVKDDSLKTSLSSALYGTKFSKTPVKTFTNEGDFLDFVKQTQLPDKITAPAIKPARAAVQRFEMPARLQNAPAALAPPPNSGREAAAARAKQHEKKEPYELTFGELKNLENFSAYDEMEKILGWDTDAPIPYKTKGDYSGMSPAQQAAIQEVEAQADYAKKVKNKFQRRVRSALGDAPEAKYGTVKFNQDSHKLIIEKALTEGKQVPESVLADYPDLAKKYSAQTAPEKPSEQRDSHRSEKLPIPERLDVWQKSELDKVEQKLIQAEKSLAKLSSGKGAKTTLTPEFFEKEVERLEKQRKDILNERSFEGKVEVTFTNGAKKEVSAKDIQWKPTGLGSIWQVGNSTILKFEKPSEQPIVPRDIDTAKVAAKGIEVLEEAQAAAGNYQKEKETKRAAAEQEQIAEARKTLEDKPDMTILEPYMKMAQKGRDALALVGEMLSKGSPKANTIINTVAMRKILEKQGLVDKGEAFVNEKGERVAQEYYKHLTRLENGIPFAEYTPPKAVKLSKDELDYGNGWITGKLADGRTVHSNGYFLAVGQPPAKDAVASGRTPNFDAVIPAMKELTVDIKPVAVKDSYRFGNVYFSNGVAADLKYFDYINAAHPSGKWKGRENKDAQIALVDKDKIVAVLMPYRYNREDLPVGVKAILADTEQSRSEEVIDKKPDLEFGDRVTLRDGTEAVFHKFASADKAEVIADGAYSTVPLKGLKTADGEPLAQVDDYLSDNAINLKTLYNKDGEFNYETIKTLAARVGSGELKITRLAPREEQGRNSGGRRNVEASIIIGAEARTGQADTRRSRPTRKEKLAHNKQVEAHLEKYARHEGIWFDYDEFTKTYPYFAKGQEAQVFEDTNKEFVLKAVNYAFGSYGISLLDFIDDRISLFNYLFPETKYELVGFTRDGDGRFRFILRQPFIVGDIPHPSKRRAYMRRVLGAESESLTPEQYINSDYHIWDLHLKNLLQDKDGNVFVIDSLLELNTPERYLDGVREYEEFRIAGAGETENRDQEIDAPLAQAATTDTGFYSQLEKTLEAKMPNRASAEQVAALIKNSQTVKPAETDEVLGAFLDDNKGKILDKRDVLDFIGANQFKVETVVKGEGKETHTVTVRLSDTAESDIKEKVEIELSKELEDENDQIDWTYFEEAVGEKRQQVWEDITAAIDTEKPLSFGDYDVKITGLTQAEANKIQESVESVDYGIADIEKSDEGETKFAREPFVQSGGTDHIEVFLTDTHFAEKGQKWKDGHDVYSDVKNPIVRVRAGTYTDTDGNKVFVVQEVQLPDAANIADVPKIYQKYGELMGFKWALNYAAANGFEKLAFTSGDTQADRYDLRKYVDRIEYRKAGLYDDKYAVQVFDKNGRRVQDELFSDAELENNYGKDIARRITESAEEYKSKELSGLDLAVGGNNLKNRYDKTYVSMLNKYLGKMGGRVGTSEIHTENRSTDDNYKYGWTDKFADLQVVPHGNFGEYKIIGKRKSDGETITLNVFDTENQARAEIEKFKPPIKTETVHAFPITDAMRESVLQGLPLFKRFSAEENRLLTEVLPAEATANVIKGASGGRMTAAGHLEINPHDAETLRRLFAEDYFRQHNKETVEQPFAAITWNVARMRRIIRLGREFSAQMAEDTENFPRDAARNFQALLDNLAGLARGATDYGITFVFDEALPEEEFHQEDLRARRTDAQAIAELKQSPLWTNPGAVFQGEYPELTDADKASELAAKLATGQAEKYGWNKRDGFEAEKAKFLSAWGRGIVREKWTVCLSDIQNGICRYYLQTIGYTDKINGEPFNREIFDSCRERAENLREQIKSLKSNYNLVQGCVSFPKDLILLESSEIEYDAKNNRFHFEVLQKIVSAY
jgi:hypothetical protein